MAPDQDPPGEDPDPRLRFANERTLLAWNRTALALIVGGLGVAQFLEVGFKGGGLIFALPVILLGALLAVSSYRHWQRTERALRFGHSLPSSGLPRTLAYGVCIVAVAAFALAIARAV